MNERGFIAYAIHYGQQSCGCPRTTYSHVYDRNGNTYKRFTSKSEAEDAARNKMRETNADNWNVI